jgi:hypothetical protein
MLRGWLATHDPAHAALRRAVRAAIIMPGLFAFGDKALAEPVVATFMAFGSFAMLLLVDFPGPVRDRLRDQAALVLACGVLICLGTLASRSTAAAAIVMALVAFAVLFSGSVSSVLAGASTALLLAFILPVSLPAGAAAIPDRLAGWGIAGGVSLFAIALLWPAPVRNPVRGGAVEACRALAARLRAEVAFANGEVAAEERNLLAVRAQEAVGQLQRAFFATPYRPSGLSTDARAVVRLVDELRWLNDVIVLASSEPRPVQANQEVCALKVAAAGVLERAAGAIEHPGDSDETLAEAITKLHDALEQLERATLGRLPAALADGSSAQRAANIVSALDPSFRSQELAFIAAQIGANARFAAAAARRGFRERLLGRQPQGLQGPLSSAGERAASFASGDSLFLRNSLRGAVALGVAVLVADIGSVEHAFWVALGAISVLRTNALSTGQSILRALAGTAIGFVIGGALVYAIGTNDDVLWVVLPIVVLMAGMAPAVIGFAAGQASFTLALLILFNLIAPAGWKIGLVRIEDVAIGGAVSLAIGLLFWPRGAGAALGRALASAYRSSAVYLAATVNYGLGCCDPTGPQTLPPRREALEAAAASRRLDDTFRGYLNERGSKPAPLAAITALVTGVTAVRLAGDAVLALWDGSSVPAGDRSAARGELAEASGRLTDWYSRFALSLVRAEEVPAALLVDEAADGRLVAAVARDLGEPDARAAATGVRVIWTGDHLDAARRLQELLVAPAREALGAIAG